MDAVIELRGVPKFVREDTGTENIVILNTQRFLNCNRSDLYRSFLFEKPRSNQKIELLWSFLIGRYLNWWISYFKDFRDKGIFDYSNVIHTEHLHFCFSSLNQEELSKINKE